MDIMINKYIAVIANSYDQDSVLEFLPFQTRYTPEDIFREQSLRIQELNRVNEIGWPFNEFEWHAARDYFSGYCGSKGLALLDTGIVLMSYCCPIIEILTIQAWLTNYSVGVKDEIIERNSVDNV